MLPHAPKRVLKQTVQKLAVQPELCTEEAVSQIMPTRQIAKDMGGVQGMTVICVFRVACYGSIDFGSICICAAEAGPAAFCSTLLNV